MLPVEFVIEGRPWSFRTHNKPARDLWLERVRTAAAHRWTGESAYLGKVRVVVIYFHEGEIAGLDTDNMAKLILDALSGLVYKDDRQAAHIDVRSINMASGPRFKRMSPLLAERIQSDEGEFLYVRVEALR